MLPLNLVPTGVLKIELPNGQSVEIPKSQPAFESCVKPESTDSFGGKPFVASELGPCFAELLILRMLRNHGWDGRWIETYPPRRGMPLLLTDWDPRGIKVQQTVPIEDADVSSMLVRIAAARGTDMQPKYSGCWDVLAWRMSEILFVESKHAGKDFLNPNQREWVGASLRCGLKLSNFLVVDWSMA